MTWKLIGAALIIGIALLGALTYDRPATRNGPTLQLPEKENRSDLRQEEPAPQQDEEPQYAEPAKVFKPGEVEVAAVQPQNLPESEEPVSAKLPEEEAASMPPATRAESMQAGKTGGAKPAVSRPRRVKHKSAARRRHVQRRARYVTFLPERRNYHTRGMR